ncbi:MAG TPA: hypothetical protein PK725_12005 [Rhodocyclaceae bacterium]|nr:hypothetical protein [Rhodocyclaceae bacterium]HRQ47667.1 hypothetical protein [Rhodocyclaceae bacterium]
MKLVPVVLAALFLAACSGTSGPDEAHVRAAVADELPDGWELVSFKIETSEDLGSKTSPRVATRFNARAKSKLDLYRYSSTRITLPPGVIGQVTPIDLAVKAGEQRDVFGTTESVRQGEGWRTSVALESENLSSLGLKREIIAAGAGRTVAMGTSEVDEFNAEIRDMIEFRKKVEDARAEEHRKYLEEQREQQAAEHARIDEQKAAAQREAHAAVLAALGAVRDLLTGKELQFDLIRGMNRVEHQAVLTLESTDLPDRLVGEIQWMETKARKSLEGVISRNDFGMYEVNLVETELLNPDEAEGRTEAARYRIRLHREDPNRIETATWRTDDRNGRVSIRGL